MKKIFYFILTMSMFIASSCNDELDELWTDPNKYTPKPEQVISGLFANIQQTRFFKGDYGEWYWILSAENSFIHQAQIVTYLPYSASWCLWFEEYPYGDMLKYPGNPNGNHDRRFTGLYSDLKNYGLIQDELAGLSGEEFDNNVIFGQLSTVVKDIVALQAVDLFNKIPFSEAYKGTQGVFFPKYDDGGIIYKSVIESYKTIAEGLPAIHSKMSAKAKVAFETQDLFFKGDINKWVQFINAQRLKAAIRISGVAEDFAKTHIADAIKNLPATDFTFACPDPNENRLSNEAGGIIQRAWYERHYNTCVPDVMMMRMNRGDSLYLVTEDDPRLPAIICGHAIDSTLDKIEFTGVSMNWNKNKYLRENNIRVNGIVRPKNTTMENYVQKNAWNYYNPATFALNELPLYLFSLGEIDLLLAEVALKEFANTGKNAGEHIYDAVIHSTDFWYAMNACPDYCGEMSPKTDAIVHPKKPDESVIQKYASTIRSEFDAAAGLEDKMEILMQQKYIHLNILQPYECFAELRRTRHPKLEPVTSGSLVNAVAMWERFKYPSSELSTNFDNYSTVSDEDNYTSHIFWVPQNKRAETYFLPNQLKK
ncbi:MAG: SusD/RagB family nutrient-binding outer membrane lipoprotein [Prevotellaceae bacterium]|nr:SusD/RagB family nutrient-binding outer membrane lipoprotein [Prevotellaceae bacterium]